MALYSDALIVVENPLIDWADFSFLVGDAPLPSHCLLVVYGCVGFPLALKWARFRFNALRLSCVEKILYFSGILENNC
jgi:hypothetical protein